METIIIEGKEFKCSKRVAEEINWLDIRLRSVKSIVSQIEDLQDELDTTVMNYQHSINKLLSELKNL